MKRASRGLALAVRWRPTLLAVAALVALWLPGINQGWYRTDTHFYAAIAEQAWESAVDRGDWSALLDLRAGDQVYLNKPPLVFILHGASIRAFGLDLWTVRLPSLVASIIGVCAAVAILRQLAGWRVAMMSGLVLATSVEYFRYGRAISLDAWQCAFVMTALWLFICGAKSRALRWCVLAGAPIGLALLCKPFVALLVPPLVGAWMLFGSHPRPRSEWVFAGVGLACASAILIAAPWHVWMYLLHGQDFIDVYIRQQSLSRAIGALDAPGAREPWWFYFRVIGEGYWPWLVTLALAMVAIARRDPVSTRGDRSAMWLGAIWSIVWLAALSAFGGKSPRYTVIIWPMLAVFSGWFLARVGMRARGRGRAIGRLCMLWLAPAMVLASLGLSGAMSAGLIDVRMHKPRHEVWDRVLATIDERPDLPVVCAPSALAMSANLVMLGRSWPPVLEDSSAVSGPAWIIIDPKQPPPARPGVRIVVESDEVVLGEVVP